MMEWNTSKLTDIVQYINNQLNTGRTMVSVESEDFGTNERVIHKRLVRAGYKKINNQYITSNITESNKKTTSNITPTIKAIKGDSTRKETTSNITPVEVVKPLEAPIKGINDIDKLNLLLDNIDKILKLIPKETTSNITSIRTGKNDVKSFRIDTGLYAAIKEKALKENINISELINRSLEDYIKNYI